MHFFSGCRVLTQMLWTSALLAPSISCGGAPEAESIPLIDRVARTDTEVVGSPDVSAVPRALWRFDGPVAPQTGLDWRDGGGIAPVVGPRRFPGLLDLLCSVPDVLDLEALSQA